MNWSIILKYFSLLVEIGMSIESMATAIAAGQSTSSPPVNTYIGGKHGSISISWTPLP